MRSPGTTKKDSSSARFNFCNRPLPHGNRSEWLPVGGVEKVHAFQSVFALAGRAKPRPSMRSGETAVSSIGKMLPCHH